MEVKRHNQRNEQELTLAMPEYNAPKSVRLTETETKVLRYRMICDTFVDGGGQKMCSELKLKVCSKCKIEKETSAFHKDKQHSDGFNSQCKSCKREFRLAWNAKHPESRKQTYFKHDLKRHYGISVEQYNTMFNAQNGCCASCGIVQDQMKRKFAVDHDHQTGVVRALLCDRCNPALGYMQDSLEMIEQLAAYLKKFKKPGIKSPGDNKVS
jgi:hypothetical protein